MYAAISRSEPVREARCGTAGDAGLQRVDGAVRLGFRRDGVHTVLSELYQHSPGRVLLPRVPAGAPPEAVLLNTAGGLTGGDRMAIAVRGEVGSEAVVTSQAAEKLYRAIDSDAAVSVSLSVEAGATLEWLPQETIAFDGGRMRRRIEVSLDEDSRLLLSECLVLGRGARGESYRHGSLSDRWHVRRGGRLLWADAFRLNGDMARLGRQGPLLGGARALATLLYAGPQPEFWRDRLRELPLPAEVRCGIGALPGLLLVRILAETATPLRRCLNLLLGTLRMEAFGRAQALPKMWSC